MCNILSSDTRFRLKFFSFGNSKILSAVVISDEECDAKHPVNIPYLWQAVKTTLDFIEKTRFESMSFPSLLVGIWPFTRTGIISNHNIFILARNAAAAELFVPIIAAIHLTQLPNAHCAALLGLTSA
jgi:hypothetical protein